MTSFLPSSSTSQRLQYRWGSGTDIGGGRENQDDFLVWTKDEKNLIILCVLDGHGREVGKVAANAAKNALSSYFTDHYEDCFINTVKFLVDAHEYAHQNIKKTFKRTLESQGFIVQESSEGYLMKKKHNMDNWACVHGGTSCSIIAVIGTLVYTANVGDSSGLLCSGFNMLRNTMIQHLLDAADGESDGRSNNETSNTNSNVLVVTAEHSPESPLEFSRLRNFRKRDNNPLQPALHVVYDSSTHDKSVCHEVFDISKDTLSPTQRGSYYKNVRKEWASLVATPSYARFQDALAFTRSLGDLHLHTYGVTHLPEVQCFDLSSIYNQLSQIPAVSKLPTANESISRNTVCIVLATDGVWDNWMYEDVGKFVMDSSCLEAVHNSNDGAQRVTDSFVQRNAYFSRKNFGSQADNATAVILYITLDAGN